MHKFKNNKRRDKELADSGVFGDIRAFSLHHHRTPFRNDKWNRWIEQECLSGGLIVEETCHWFDLARYVTGKEIDSLHCLTAGGINTQTDFEDAAYINGRCTDGAVFQIAHTLSGFDFSLVLQIHGTNGTAWCGLKEEPYTSFDNGQTEFLGLLSYGKAGQSPHEATIETWGKEATEPFNIRDLAGDFARCAAENKTPAASFKDGILSLEASLCARESARSGQIIQMGKQQ